MATVADITADIVSLVNASGISGDDVLQVTVTLNPVGLMVRCQQRDSGGNVIIDTNGDPLVLNVCPVPVVVNETQFSDQT